jgi:hypothetical protein
MQRKVLLTVVVLLMSYATVSAQAPQGSNQPKGERSQPVKLDGEWTVQYAEMDGKVIENRSVTNVTIKNNTVTCKHDGKEKTWRLEFGPHHMVRCVEQIEGKTTSDTGDKRQPDAKGHHSHHGVYIASQEYFCLCMNKGMDRRPSATSGTERPNGGVPPAQPRQPAPGFGNGEHGPMSSAFVLILRRNSTAK